MIVVYGTSALQRVINYIKVVKIFFTNIYII